MRLYIPLMPPRALALFILCAACSAHAQPDSYDFDFVTITNPGNPAFNREPTNVTHRGRGSVDHEYRMARTEISTAQWMEFANVLSRNGQVWFSRITPLRWGAVIDQSAPTDMPQFKLNPTLFEAENVPVGGITYGQAAMYCNWLHNGKQDTIDSLMSGAYELTAHGFGKPGIENTSHLDGAKYWIPTLDEWMKAAYWDPNKPEHDGWWLYPHMSDGPPIPGPPGVGETNAGYLDTFDDWTRFRIGEYEDTITPWSLLDATGGVSEWTEEEFGSNATMLAKGAVLGDLGLSNPVSLDRVDSGTTHSTFFGSISVGFRIASSVPAPSTALTLALPTALLARRRRT